MSKGFVFGRNFLSGAGDEFCRSSPTFR